MEPTGSHLHHAHHVHELQVRQGTCVARIVRMNGWLFTAEPLIAVHPVHVPAKATASVERAGCWHFLREVLLDYPWHRRVL